MQSGQIKNKIIQILGENQIIELSDLIDEIDISDKPLIIKVLKNLIDSDSISAREEGDSIFFTLPS